jgi:hypothetical protein
MKSPRFASVTIALLMLAGAESARAAAVTINWNNSPGQQALMADGSTSLNGTFSFQLGVFGSTASPFAPTPSNFADWFLNWHPMDTAQWDSGSTYFTGSITLNDNNIFEAGAQAYVWAYNNQGLFASSQWLLLTDDSSDGSSADNWTVPTAGSSNQTNPPVDWVINCDHLSPVPDYNVIWGGVDDEQGADAAWNAANNPDVSIFTAPTGTPPANQFCLQVHQLAVPEPTSALALVSGLALIARRRRRAS